MQNMLNPISIANLIEKSIDYSANVSVFNDKFIITDHLGYSDLFKYPCRIDAVSILICTNGNMECIINFKHYVVEKNTVIICRSGDIFQILNSDNFEAYAGLVATELLNELKISFWSKSNYFSPKFFMRKISDNELNLLCYYYPLVRDSIKYQCVETSLIIQNLIQAFVYTIVSIMNGNEIKHNIKLSRNEQIFDQFIALLSQYHNSERSVEFYASKMCLTPNYLSSCIKNCSGRTALEWVTDYVILEAKTLLLYSSFSVQEIAFRLNFPTQSAFGKYFKQKTGKSPKCFRKDGDVSNI